MEKEFHVNPQIKSQPAFSLFLGGGGKEKKKNFEVIYLKSFTAGTDRVLFGLISVETKT